MKNIRFLTQTADLDDFDLEVVLGTLKTIRYSRKYRQARQRYELGVLGIFALTLNAIRLLIALVQLIRKLRGNQAKYGTEKGYQLLMLDGGDSDLTSALTETDQRMRQ